MRHGRKWIELLTSPDLLDLPQVFCPPPTKTGWVEWEHRREVQWKGKERRFLGKQEGFWGNWFLLRQGKQNGSNSIEKLITLINMIGKSKLLSVWLLQSRACVPILQVSLPDKFILFDTACHAQEIHDTEIVHISLHSVMQLDIRVKICECPISWKSINSLLNNYWVKVGNRKWHEWQNKKEKEKAVHQNQVKISKMLKKTKKKKRGGMREHSKLENWRSDLPLNPSSPPLSFLPWATTPCAPTGPSKVLPPPQGPSDGFALTKDFLLVFVRHGSYSAPALGLVEGGLWLLVCLSLVTLKGTRRRWSEPHDSWLTEKFLRV